MPTLLPGRVTLASLRYQARTRADRWPKGAPVEPQSPDFFADDYITTPELNLMIQASAGELYELMVVQYSNYWFTDKYLITADGTNEQFALPLNMLKHLSTEWVATPTLVNGVNTNNTNNVVLDRFNLQERDFLSFSGLAAPPVYGTGVCKYSVFGTNLWFKPVPPGGTVFQTLYVPLPLPLVDSGSITMNGVVAGNTLTIIANGTSYTFTAIAHGGSPTSAQFVVGGSGANTGDVGTAASLTAKLNASGLGGLAGPLKAYNSATVLGGTQVQVCLINPAVIVWSTSGNTLLLSPNEATDSAGTVVSFSNTMTGYAGLSEYLVVDAAIKILQKEESDTSVLMAQKQALIARYKQNYQNRDPGRPRTGTDVKRAWSPFGTGGFGRW